MHALAAPMGNSYTIETKLSLKIKRELSAANKAVRHSNGAVAHCS